MDQMTQQNAAMVEEMNAAGATLAQESSRLSELLARFEVSRNNGRDQRSFAPGRLAMAS
jgi:methyl-accepting chemotaxis protein